MVNTIVIQKKTVKPAKAVDVILSVLASSTVLGSAGSAGIVAARTIAMNTPTTKNGSQATSNRVGPKGTSQTPPAQVTRKRNNSKIQILPKGALLPKRPRRITTKTTAIENAIIKSTKNIFIRRSLSLTSESIITWNEISSLCARYDKC